MCQLCLQGIQNRTAVAVDGGVSTATYFSGVNDANGTNFATPTGDNNVDGLLIGTRWNSTNLTFAFPTSSTYYTTPYEIAPGEFDDGYVTSFVAFNASWQAAARSALNMFASVSGLTFTEVSPTTQADVVFAQTTDTSIGTASGRFPGWNNEGHQWYRTSNYDVTPVQGTYTWHTIIHETGHTLGLAHGHSPDSINPAWTGVAMNSDRDGMEFSVMTYREYPGAVIDGYSNETFGYAQSLMMYDIRAVQQLYGANFNHNSGNTVYTWDATTGNMFINGVQATDPGANRVFLTVWDGNGIDTYDMSNYTTNLVVDLTPGSWSTLSAAQLANLGNGVMARANVFNALLFNEDARSLIENATGGTGNDRLVGNRAVNLLTGNGGEDILVGAGGNDILVGGLGNDTLWGDATDGSAPVSGIGMGTGLHLHSNIYDSSALAFDLTNTFSLAANANILDATGTPHTTMRYSDAAGGVPQWYRITLNAGSTISLDIDATNGTDTYVRIMAANGTTVLAFSDDNGGDTGSSTNYDSRLTYTVTTTGTYYIVVGEYPSGTDNFEANEIYDLHVSVSPPSSTVLGTDGAFGNDVLNGDAGNDTLYGGSGRDWLFGGTDADTATGGVDADWFAFDGAGTAGDVITDYAATDRLYFGNNSAAAVFSVVGSTVTVNGVQLTYGTADNVTAITQVGGTLLGSATLQAGILTNGTTLGLAGLAYILTEFDANSNEAYRTRSDYFNASNQLDYSWTYMDAGQAYHSRYIDYDQGSAATWARIESTYITAGVLDYQWTYYDAGGTVHSLYNELDQANSGNWNSIQSTYSAPGVLDFQWTYYDVGYALHSAFVNYDQTNSNNWTTINQYYISAGVMDYQWTYYDVGQPQVSQFIDYDQANANTWSSIQTAYSATNVVDFRWTYYDAGQPKYADFIDYDQANAATWSSQAITYSALGVIDYRWTYYDAGQPQHSEFIDFDQANAATWSSQQIAYSAPSVIDYRWTYYDAGQPLFAQFIDYDQANAYSWSQHIINYSAPGVVSADYYV